MTVAFSDGTKFEDMVDYHLDQLGQGGNSYHNALGQKSMTFPDTQDITNSSAPLSAEYFDPTREMGAIRKSLIRSRVDPSELPTKQDHGEPVIPGTSAGYASGRVYD